MTTEPEPVGTEEAATPESAARRVENAAVQIALQWGWYVFPVRVFTDSRTRKKSKVPAVERWNTPGIGCWNTEAEIREAFQRERGAKIGVACGPSKIVVVDQDHELAAGSTAEWEEALDPTRTLVLKSQSWTETTPWRRHFVFTVGTGPGYRSGALPVGDIKGVGGFVVLGSGRVDGSGSVLAPPPDAIAAWLAPAGSVGSAEEVTDDELEAALIGTSLHTALIGVGSGERYLKVQEVVNNHLNEQHAKWGSRDHAVYRTLCGEVITCMAGGYPLQLLLDWCSDWLASHTYDSSGNFDPMDETFVRAKAKRALGWVTDEDVEQVRSERFFNLDPDDLFDWDSTLTNVDTDPDSLVLEAADSVMVDAAAAVEAEAAAEAAARGLDMPSIAAAVDATERKIRDARERAAGATDTGPDWAGDLGADEPGALDPAIASPPALPALPVPAADDGSGTGPPPREEEAEEDPPGDADPGDPVPDGPPADLPVEDREETPAEIAARVALERQVARKLEDMRANALAKGLLVDEIAAERWNELASHIDMRTADAVLLDPQPVEVWSIENFLQAGQSILISASPKAGKTRLALNLARAFTDGAPFLGTLKTRAGGLVGKTAYLQADMTAGQFTTWTREQSLVRPDRMWMIDLQGRTAGFDIRSEPVRMRWVEMLRAQGCVGGALIVDVMQSLLAGLGLSESNDDLGQILEALISLKVEAELEHLVILHHHGHGSERARGGSVLLGKFDVIADLVLPGRGLDDSTGAGTGGSSDGGTSALAGAPRFFKAYGRGVELEESRLRFEPATGHMHLEKGTSRNADRAGKKNGKLMGEVFHMLGEEKYIEDGVEKIGWMEMSMSDLRGRLRGSNDAKDLTIKQMEDDGLVTRVTEVAAPGKRGARKQYMKLTEAGQIEAAAIKLAEESPDLFSAAAGDSE